MLEGYKAAEYGCSGAEAKSVASLRGSALGSSAFLPITDNHDTETHADLSQTFI